MANGKPGAPKKPEHLKSKPFNITMKPHVREWAKAIGEGSISAGIHKAVTEQYNALQAGQGNSN